MGYGNAVGVKATPHSFRHLKGLTLLNRGASLSRCTIQVDLRPLHAKVSARVVEHYSARPAEQVGELQADAPVIEGAGTHYLARACR